MRRNGAPLTAQQAVARLSRWPARRRRLASVSLLWLIVGALAVGVAAVPAFATEHSLVPGSETLRELLGGDQTDSARRGDRVFARAGEVALRLPSRQVERIGFHEANHRGARGQSPRDAGPPSTTMASRGRATGPRSAADVVAAPDEPVLAPVTGRVVRSGSYVMYCKQPDHFVVIAPDAHPQWEVKVLHFEGLQVEPGDRVTASRTALGTRPRTLPFRSQVDDYSHPRDWPHLHVEVVDPSIPNPSSGGC